MVLDARRRHSLRIGDVGVISIDEHSRIRQVVGEEVCGPEFAVCVCPCLERVIIATARIQSMDEDKAMETQYQLLSFTLVAWYMVGTLENVLDLRGVGWGIHLLEEGKLVLLRVLLINQIHVFAVRGKCSYHSSNVKFRCG